jgi:hypothetical protein
VKLSDRFISNAILLAITMLALFCILLGGYDAISDNI